MELKTYSRDDVLRLVRELIDAHGDQHRLARAINVTPGYISNVVCGRCPPGPALLREIGLEAVQTVVYREVGTKEQACTG